MSTRDTFANLYTGPSSYLYTMRLFTSSTAFLCLLANAASAMPARRQAPNPSYPSDPLSQTASYNLTAFLLPIQKSVAEDLSRGRRLLEPQGLPDGFLQPDEHPLVYVTGLLGDIRQGPLHIEEILSANAYLPFVDALEDGQTPYTFDVVNLQNKLIPVLAGSLQQSINLQKANFNPDDRAWRDLDGGLFSQDVDQGIPKEGNIGGLPVLNKPTVTAVWHPVDKGVAVVADAFFKGVLSAPYIHTYSGRCSKTTFDYGQAFAQPFYVKGDVTGEYGSGED